MRSSPLLRKWMRDQLRPYIPPAPMVPSLDAHQLRILVPKPAVEAIDHMLFREYLLDPHAADSHWTRAARELCKEDPSIANPGTRLQKY